MNPVLPHLVTQDWKTFNWTNWQATEVATLCFIRCEGRILLIRKKRGLGAGKINGPGGRIEPGETIAQCAIRECEEELHITPHDPVAAGVLHFQFTDGYALTCHVFTALTFTGVPTETDEAAPLWFAEKEIPYDEMWRDDREWMPMLLEGRPFEGRFVFDSEMMVTCELDFAPAPRE